MGSIKILECNFMHSQCQNVSFFKHLSGEALKHPPSPIPNLQLMALHMAISSDTHFILICRQTIRMSLLCPHWAATRVNEQLERHGSLNKDFKYTEGGREWQRGEIRAGERGADGGPGWVTTETRLVSQVSRPDQVAYYCHSG